MSLKLELGVNQCIVEMRSCKWPAVTLSLSHTVFEIVGVFIYKWSITKVQGYLWSLITPVLTGILQQCNRLAVTTAESSITFKLCLSDAW